MILNKMCEGLELPRAIERALNETNVLTSAQRMGNRQRSLANRLQLAGARNPGVISGHLFESRDEKIDVP